ncbi:hypothetical protein [uncultured Phocaeicola sp.]|uniref:hypothetical protein n=1 Tax=uncultured Phocaeicola sp. TaxID=990718 RepID=UPI001433A0DF|nr:hypothetical protein [uncultured Phocaeicola sp.]GFH99933.1 hypothetical protein IMSAGC004_02338 [Bacteroidaceae bacterium]
MKPNIIHSIVVCLAAFALPFMVACGSQEESLPNHVTEAVLYLNIEPIGQTRADLAEQLPDNEKMKSVRVIVLHKDGTVEHNRHYPLEGAQAQRTILLKVTPNEKKKIFLFANEESVSTVKGVTAGGVTVEGENRTLTGFFESYAEGHSGFEIAVNDLYFAPDYMEINPDGNLIPMSSMYEIDFPAKGNFDGTFYVVRAATKFTFRFKNMRGGAVKVNGISVSEIATDMYLMPHKRNLMMEFEEEGGGKTELPWIEWLKRVSDESQADPDNKELADKRGWITDYAIPPTVGSEKATVSAPQDFQVPAYTTDMGVPKPGTEVFPAFYLPESKHLKTQDDTYGEQTYTMTFDFTDEKSEHKTFDCPFNNLKALFRNTNVVVDVTLGTDEGISVDVIPYSEVILDPEFGL